MVTKRMRNIPHSTMDMMITDTNPMMIMDTMTAMGNTPMEVTNTMVTKTLSCTTMESTLMSISKRMLAVPILSQLGWWQLSL